MSGTGFVWFWKNDEGSWTPYGDEHQDAIERERLRGEDHVILQIGPNQRQYLLDFKDEIQENLELGHRRLISRANEFTVWYWRDDDGVTWNVYDQEHAEILTRAEAEQEPEVYLVINEALYRIDLPRRLQINFDNHSGNHTREIRQGRPSATQRQDGHPNDGDPLDDETPDPEMETAAPPSFSCPISFHIMRDPVTTSAGSTYDRKAIQWWLKDHDTDPLTKRPIRDKLLVPNNAMKLNIEDWKQRFLNDRLNNANADYDSKPPANDHKTKPQEDLCQDTLKVVFLGRNKTGTTSIVRKLANLQGSDKTENNVPDTKSSAYPGVKIYDWQPTNSQPLLFHLWDFEGPDSLHSYRSMGFSSETLFVVVWDMGLSNPKTATFDNHTSQEDADFALERDIHDKVQFWVDRIREKVPDAVILPLASVGDASHTQNRRKLSLAHGSPPGATEREAKRRCQVLREKLSSSGSALLFGADDDPVLRVHSGSSSVGLSGLQQKLIELAGNSKLFDHMGASRSVGIRHVRQSIQSLKGQGYKLIDTDLLAGVLPKVGNSTDEIREALPWLSNMGEILHFPELAPPFDRIIVLDIPWWFGLCGCILRYDWKVLVNDCRRRNGLEAAPTFGGAGSENCPVLSKEDASMLWLNHMATTDFGSSLSAGRFKLTNVLDYVQMLMIHMGILVPVDQDLGPFSNRNIYTSDFTVKAKRYISASAAQVQPTAYLTANLLCIPDLLRKGDHGDGLSDASFIAGSVTSLAQKVEFQEKVSDCFMGKVIIALLRNITNRLKEDEGSNPGSTFAVERVHCWRSVIRLRFSWKKTNMDRDEEETTVEVCSQLVEGTRKDRGNQACLFTSANVVKGDGGHAIWVAGYGIVLETIHAIVEGHNGLTFTTSVFCHDCLASRGIHRSHFWKMDEIDAALKDGRGKIKCGGGHVADLQLLTGTGSDVYTRQHSEIDPTLKKAIVLVGLYDARRRTDKARRFGSGVIVDAARGLIVSAARNVMKIEGEENFGQNYDGILGGKIVIGMVPDNGGVTVFRYFATIVSKDPTLTSTTSKCCRVDVCVLKIMSRFESDVEGNVDNCCDEIELLLRDNTERMAAQGLVQLPMQIKSNLEDRVRIFGFEQGANGSAYGSLSHIAGYICQKKSATGSPADQFKFRPLNMTVVMATTRPGHIGGPCVNQAGEIVGILACSDPDEDSRSFVVPVSEWIEMVRLAT